MKTFPVLTFTAALLSGGTAMTNDGFGSLGVGGVVLGHTDKVAMVKEELSINPFFIHVSYIFENESDQDVSETISFPLPPYPANPHESGVIANGQPDGFTITVDGQPRRFETRVRAVMEDGRDVTDLLKAQGFSERDIALTPYEHSIQDEHRLDRAPEVLKALGKAGLIDEERKPLWINHVAYEWKETFPAHKPVKVYHGYRPFSSSGAWSGFVPDHNWDEGEDLIKDFCASKATIDKLTALYKNPDYHDSYGDVPGTVVEYVLTTGNSWKDGIRDFTLKIDKVAPYTLVATCFEGKFTKQDGVTLISHIKNFHPKENLRLYFGNYWAWVGSQSMRPSFDGSPSKTPEFPNVP